MSYKKIDDLAQLLESYHDPEEENVRLQTRLLNEGFSLTSQIFTKCPGIKSLLIKKGLPDSFINYVPSYSGQYKNYTDDGKQKLLLFFDDLWTIEIQNPEFNIKPFYIDGHKLIHVMKQGINGVLPRIIKTHFKVPANDIRFKNIDFKIKIFLNIEHKNYSKTLRYKMTEGLQSRFKTPEEELQNILTPSNLFRSLILTRPNSEDKELLNERLKFWGKHLSSKSFKEVEVQKLVNNLPINNFGQNNMILLRNIAKSFHTKVSNDILLSGQLAHTYFGDQHKLKFNHFLKKCLN